VPTPTVLDVSCHICGSSAPKEVTTGIAGVKSSVLLCRSCTTEFLHPQPSWEEIKSLYSADYYKSWNMQNGERPVVAEMKKGTFRKNLKRLETFVSSGKILDVGTATGFFLEVARDMGFDPYGVEVSEFSGSIAAKKFGADHIHIGTLETAPFPPETFSAMAMSDLLEHVTDPIGVLKCSHKLLAPNGVLMITTPDCSSLSHNLMGDRWTHYKLEHLFYPSPNSMRLMAKKSGFRVLKCERAKKVMSLAYLNTQFKTYPHWALTPLSAAATTAAQGLANKYFTVTMGELLVFLGKA
jgi:2-polyprenyl-3-methyl-5-hydroxy-6-metoxy-1,4-benzoquinol methylase